MHHIFGKEQKFPWCWLCLRRCSKSILANVCLNCLRSVCIDCSKVVTLDWDRWCDNCVKFKNKKIIFEESDIKEISEQRLTPTLTMMYPTNYPMIFHIKDCVPRDMFDTVQKELKTFFKKFIKGKKWDVKNGFLLRQ